MNEKTSIACGFIRENAGWYYAVENSTEVHGN
jgi:hypothetical protein